MRCSSITCQLLFLSEQTCLGFLLKAEQILRQGYIITCLSLSAVHMPLQNIQNVSWKMTVSSHSGMGWAVEPKKICICCNIVNHTASIKVVIVNLVRIGSKADFVWGDTFCSSVQQDTIVITAANFACPTQRFIVLGRPRNYPCCLCQDRVFEML